MSVMVQFLCQLDWDKGAQIAGETLSLSVSVRVFLEEHLSKEVGLGTSLVAQWLRICLPMQGTRIRALVWEDPTCLGATKPVRHNY